MRHRGPEMRFLVHVVLTLWVSWARGQEIICDPPSIANSDFVPEMNIYKRGDVITYECVNGFHAPFLGNTATCTSAGWVPSPRCSRTPCEFPYIKHGHLDDGERYKPYFPVAIGRSFLYVCDENFLSSPGGYWDRITCTPEGWSPEVPCLRKCVLDDSDYEKPLFKRKGYLQGGSMKVDCPPGYSLLHSQSSVTCTENGWSPPPRCIKHCDMPIFENARAVITGKAYRPSDTLDYQCLDGYENRDGSTAGSMLCGEDGWSQLPTCFKSAEKCGPPPAISNGDITSFPLETYLPGSRVEYQCQAYYELWGPTFVTCSHAKWSKPPRCINPCVISEETMNDKNIQLKGKDDKTYYVKTGDIVEFTCKAGHSAVTSEQSFQATCKQGRVEFPRCE